MTDSELHIIALADLAAGLDTKGSGMAGFREFAMKKLTPADRKFLDRYQAAKASAAPRIAALWDEFEKQRGKGTAP